MTNPDRLMIAGGPAGVALLLVGNSMAASDLPSAGASERELQAYLTALDPSWLGGALEIFGLIALLVFAVGLSRLVGSTLVLAGGAAGVAVKLATALPTLAIWMRPEGTDPGLAGFVLDLGTIGFAASGALLALIPAGVAAAGTLPGWLRIGGAVTAVALLAQVPLMREEFGLGFLLLMLWIIATGTTLLRGRAVGAHAGLQPA